MRRISYFFASPLKYYKKGATIYPLSDTIYLRRRVSCDNNSFYGISSKTSFKDLMLC